MTLAMPVRHPATPAHVLLKLGFELDAATLTRLDELGVRSLWVRCPSLDFLTKLINPEILAAQGEVVTHISKAFESLQKDTTPRLAFDSYTKAVGDLVTQLVSNPQASVFMGDLALGGGHDLMRHSSTTAYLSLLMGLKLEGYVVKQRRHLDAGRAKEVINLGLGAMLHDIGITKLDVDVRERYERTGDETDAAWQEHPALGYGLVRGRIEPSAATVVLNHHQRYDGSGYAGRDVPVLAGERAHFFARIVGLAEQFDRLRFPQNLPAQPTVFALAALLTRPIFQKFDANAVRALFCVVPPYPPGSVVRLSDGRWAAVVEHVSHDPCRPTVQTIDDPQKPEAAAGETIVLSKTDRSLHVASIGGTRVSELNFPAPAFLHDSDLALAYA